jgi:hypothetical protein
VGWQGKKELARASLSPEKDMLEPSGKGGKKVSSTWKKRGKEMTCCRATVGLTG